ncbi:MAG: M23 family metallopeptidase [Bacteroidales bacterium]|nr:M23 family metallopeptidase [Bacteroidales bacterium]
MLFRSFPKLIIIIFLITVTQVTFSQKSYPTGYFQPPVDFRMLLSGTFGEVRANHFHSGIDIKTGGVEGSSVYAIADGYVSRIKVSALGFGRALYVTHSNGYVSVYAHLNRYNKVIEDYVRKEQYSEESFEIELFPSLGEILVKKGEIIAYSGNSGSSGGPHLHFEIRDGASQKIINPLLFGYVVKDIFRPRISLLKIYPEDENARVNGNNRSYSYPVEGWGEKHRLNVSQPIHLSGKVSFAIQVSDQQNDTDNKNGPYSIALYIDKELAYQYRMETFSFDETRYVNSLLDYAEYMKSGVRLQRTRIDPGNKLRIYNKTGDHGTFSFNDTLQHGITYEVKDVIGNTALLTFKVKSEKPEILVSKQSSTSNFPISNFNYNTSNHFENTSVILDAPAGVFYDSFHFKYDSTRRVTGTFSAVQRIHDKFTPVHDYITLSIKPRDLPERLRDKALIVKINDDGKGFTSVGGKWESNGYVRAKIREFGNYSVSVDTMPPKINPVQAETFKNLTGQKKIKFIISDEMSGISTYRGTLNGKWVLMEYDAKNDLLFYTIDEQLLKGENNMKLEVVDMKNNRKIYQAILVR